MLSTTLITFAPGWRWMLRMIAGVVLNQAPSLVFSGAFSTVATSREPHRRAALVGDDQVPGTPPAT